MNYPDPVKKIIIRNCRACPYSNTNVGYYFDKVGRKETVGSFLKCDRYNRMISIRENDFGDELYEGDDTRIPNWCGLFDHTEKCSYISEERSAKLSKLLVEDEISMVILFIIDEHPHIAEDKLYSKLNEEGLKEDVISKNILGQLINIGMIYNFYDKYKLTISGEMIVKILDVKDD